MSLYMYLHYYYFYIYGEVGYFQTSQLSPNSRRYSVELHIGCNEMRANKCYPLLFHFDKVDMLSFMISSYTQCDENYKCKYKDSLAFLAG